MATETAVQNYHGQVKPVRERDRNYYYEASTERTFYQKNPDGTTTVIVERDPPQKVGEARPELTVRPVEPVKPLGSEEEPRRHEDTAIVYHNPLYRD